MGGITIVKDHNGPTGPQVTVDRRLYLTEDGTRVVEEGDPDGKFVYCTPGKRVSRDELLRLGAQIVNPGEAESTAPDPVVEAEVEPAPSYEDMTVLQLKDLLAEAGLKVSGNKADLVARLEELAAETAEKEDAAAEDKSDDGDAEDKSEG